MIPKRQAPWYKRLFRWLKKKLKKKKNVHKFEPIEKLAVAVAFNG